MAHFRNTLLAARHDLFVPILLYAQDMGGLTLGNIRLDGPTIHADASKSRAISSKRLLALASPLHTEVDKVFARPAPAEQPAMPEGGASPHLRVLRALPQCLHVSLLPPFVVCQGVHGLVAPTKHAR
jgi:hypothetical protein